MLTVAALSAAGCGPDTDDRDVTAPHVSGVDGSGDLTLLFTETQLEKALLDANELPGGGRQVSKDRGTFNQVAGQSLEEGDRWADCPTGAKNDLLELSTFRARSVVQQLLPSYREQAAGRGTLTETVLSMTEVRANRYFELKRAIYKGCPKTAVDSEAGPPQTYRYTAEDVELGDDAFVEKSESRDTDADPADRGPSYEIYVRIGGVIVTSGGWKDRDAALAATATAAKKARTMLYPDS